MCDHCCDRPPRAGDAAPKAAARLRQTEYRSTAGPGSRGEGGQVPITDAAKRPSLGYPATGAVQVGIGAPLNLFPVIEDGSALPEDTRDRARGWPAEAWVRMVQGGPGEAVDHDPVGALTERDGVGPHAEPPRGHWPLLRQPWARAAARASCRTGCALSDRQPLTLALACSASTPLWRRRRCIVHPSNFPLNGTGENPVGPVWKTLWKVWKGGARVSRSEGRGTDGTRRQALPDRLCQQDANRMLGSCHAT